MLPRGLATDFRMGSGANEFGKIAEIGKNCDINSKHFNDIVNIIHNNLNCRPIKSFSN